MNQIIHAAVRRDLARTESALRALREGDTARAAEIQRAWGALWGQLRHHHEPPALFILGRVFGMSYHRRIAPVWR